MNSNNNIICKRKNNYFRVGKEGELINKKTRESSDVRIVSFTLLSLHKEFFKMDNQTRFKIIKMLGLLGSDQDGEVLAAARAIKTLLASKGLTFGDLVNAFGETPQVVEPRRPEWTKVVDPAAEGLSNMAEAILKNADMLREHELKFVKGMFMQAQAAIIGGFEMKPLSEKQSNWFSFLFARYGEH